MEWVNVFPPPPVVEALRLLSNDRVAEAVPLLERVRNAAPKAW